MVSLAFWLHSCCSFSGYEKPVDKLPDRYKDLSIIFIPSYPDFRTFPLFSHLWYPVISTFFLGPPVLPPPLSVCFYILISFSPLYADFESICPYSFINSLDFRFSLPFIVPSLCSSPIVLSLCFHVISPPHHHHCSIIFNPFISEVSIHIILFPSLLSSIVLWLCFHILHLHGNWAGDGHVPLAEVGRPDWRLLLNPSLSDRNTSQNWRLFITECLYSRRCIGIEFAEVAKALWMPGDVHGFSVWALGWFKCLSQLW